MTEPTAAIALQISAGLCVVAILTCWLLSVVTQEHSWTDRAWSILPPVYLWVFAVTAMSAGSADPRLVVMAVLGTLWGVRLTLNFARKGGYRPGGEDYRWAWLRHRMTPGRFAVFNLVFIAGYQNVLLLLIALPAWTVVRQPGGFGVAEAVLTGLFLLCLAGETLADQQQWRFQQARHARVRAGLDDPGFVRTGLFAVSRHPNYFFEIAQWWLIAGFGALAAGGWLQPGSLGAVLLTLLFVGSIAITERISRSRHPAYPAYQRQVWPLLPWFPRRPPRAEPGSEHGTDPVRSGGP